MNATATKAYIHTLKNMTDEALLDEFVHVWVKGAAIGWCHGWSDRESASLNDVNEQIAAAKKLILEKMVSCPIVRCKDCKHRPIQKDQGIYIPIDPDLMCEDYTCPCLNPDDSGFNYVPDDDFFCGHGEVK